MNVVYYDENNSHHPKESKYVTHPSSTMSSKITNTSSSSSSSSSRVPLSSINNNNGLNSSHEHDDGKSKLKLKLKSKPKAMKKKSTSLSSMTKRDDAVVSVVAETRNPPTVSGTQQRKELQGLKDHTTTSKVSQEEETTNKGLEEVRAHPQVQVHVGVEDEQEVVNISCQNIFRDSNVNEEEDESDFWSEEMTSLLTLRLANPVYDSDEEEDYDRDHDYDDETDHDDVCAERDHMSNTSYLHEVDRLNSSGVQYNIAD